MERRWQGRRLWYGNANMVTQVRCQLVPALPAGLSFILEDIDSILMV